MRARKEEREEKANYKGLWGKKKQYTDKMRQKQQSRLEGRLGRR